MVSENRIWDSNWNKLDVSGKLEALKETVLEIVQELRDRELVD